MSDILDLVHKRNDAALLVAIRSLNENVAKMAGILQIVANQQATLSNQFRELQNQILSMQASRMGSGPTAPAPKDWTPR